LSRRAPRPRLGCPLRAHGHHGREGGVHWCVLYNAAAGVRGREYPITLDKLIDWLPNLE
jgi:hypothetical protein